jgi:hypothetical protein
MRTSYKIFLCFLLHATRMLAQSPHAAARAPSINASFGYSYLNLAIPPSNRVGLKGAGAAVTANLFPRLGVRADLSFVRASNVVGSGYHSDVLSYLAGPVLYPLRHRRFGAYLEGLVGAARLTGVAYFPGGGFSRGWANKLSWEFGGGTEYRISEALSLRAGVGAQHIASFNSSGAMRGHYDYRATTSLVFSIGGRFKRWPGSKTF